MVMERSIYSLGLSGHDFCTPQSLEIEMILLGQMREKAKHLLVEIVLGEIT